jgi:hypothetical protein
MVIEYLTVTFILRGVDMMYVKINLIKELYTI